MIVFSDMDGTFLTSDKDVSPASTAALDALAERGIGFVPCTGRALTGVPPQLLAHPAVRFAVTSNGASVVELDPDDPSPDAARTLRTVPLARESALAVWRIAREHDVTFDVFADGHSYLRRDLYDRMAEFVSEPGTLASMRGNRTPVDAEPEQTIASVGTLERLAMYWRDRRDREEILRALADVPGIAVTSSHPKNIEVMDESASKGASLAWLCGHLGIDPAEAVAFGDNFNDIEMLETAGTGIAVANAEPEVLAHADRQTAGNDEDGVARAIMELLGAGPAQAR